MSIRAFQSDDEDAVVDLWDSAGLVRPWNDPRADIARKLTVQPELFLVGLVGTGESRRVAATAMAGFDGHRGWVNYLAVDVGSRGRGYARQLMGEIEARLEAIGCPKLNLQVRAGNTEALAFYRAIGYTEDAAISLGKRLIPDD
jgi:ribosomal protein S18 acetylase RimI-like enzyme